MLLTQYNTNQGQRITFQRQGVLYTGDLAHPVYNQAYSGNSLNLILTKNVWLPTDADKANLIARGASFDWSENYNILPVVEYNTYFIQEQVIGLQELGRGSIATFEILRIGDALPTVKTLAWEPEITMLEVVGDDHPQHELVLNAFFGCRIVGQGGSFNPTSLAGRNLSMTYRYRLSGKDYKLIAGDSRPYPGPVQKVPMEPSPA